MKKKLDIYDKAIYVMLVLMVPALLFGLYLLVRIYLFDVFPTPTESMLPTILPGDRVVVNKLIAGARIYDEFKFGEGVPMKSHRVKGGRNVRHNDIVVFNFPLNRRKYKMEFDIRSVYCKRCIGLPGDSVSIRNGFFRNNRYAGTLGDTCMQRILSSTPDSLIPYNVIHAMPFDPVRYNWTVKEFGPLYIPHKGGCVELTPVNYRLYELAIEFETGLRPYVTPDGRMMLGEEPFRVYAFTKNYYFMCGDHVMDSNDSRYWGFVPEEFIIGVASRVLYSKDKQSGEFRWNRLFKSLTACGDIEK